MKIGECCQRGGQFEFALRLLMSFSFVFPDVNHLSKLASTRNNEVALFPSPYTQLLTTFLLSQSQRQLVFLNNLPA